ncbi:MAG TPA: AAA family ATPase, partial [Dissulfurispiraceae bacterium]|nr:AAA family ATPase [Dissulfurispiraceae bacterium]
MSTYRIFYGLQREPFCQDMKAEDLMKSDSMVAAQQRVQFAIGLCAVAVLTGDIGSGKSSALRFACSKLHTSEVQDPLSDRHIRLGDRAVQADVLCTGYRNKGNLQSNPYHDDPHDLARARQKPVIIIDEASLMRLDVFTEFHTIAQFEGDSKPILAMILAGQNNLIDYLMFEQSRSLASRVVAKGHMEALKKQETAQYLQHHLRIAGTKENLFSEQAVTAIHQGSAGLLRRA